MARQEKISKNLDWITVLLFIVCVVVGWANIYAAIYNPENPLWITDTGFFDTNAGKQLIPCVASQKLQVRSFSSFGARSTISTRRFNPASAM